MSERSMIRARDRATALEQRRSRRRAKQLSTGVAAAIGATALFAPSADAATFQVTNLNDAGPGSLRDAVTSANLAADADTITFASGLSGQITLATGEIPIDAAVDIQGPGAGNLTVSGDDSSRIFNIDVDNVGAPRDPVTISGLTLADGNSGSDGGAIYADESALTLTAMTLKNNYASSNSGAIDIESSPLTIVDSRLTGNEAGTNGGAMYVDGDADPLPDPDFNDTVTIRNTVISNNYADGDGGALYVDNATGGDVLIVGSEISNNESTGQSGGLELYGHQGSVTIRNSTISGNSTEGTGGGIYFDSDYDDTDGLLIENSTISGNRADDNGGGVYVENSDNHPVRFLNSTVTNNRSSDLGGGIYRNDYNVTLSSTIVADNRYAGGDQDDLGEDPVATGAFVTGFSLIERDADLVTLFETPAGSNIFEVDPQLGLLANNGGATQTQLAPITSRVIDAGIANGLATDQRGLARTVDQPTVPNATGSDGTDIGAVELGDLSLEGANLTAKKTQKQKGKKIKVKVKASATEVVDVLASGKIKAGKKSYPLKDVKADDIPAGTTKTLTLKPKKKTATKKIVKFLTSGKKAKATISGLFTDNAGNTDTKSVKVTLKGAKKKK